MMAAQVDVEKKKLGLIVNPLAGIGGRVGLKGSDGQTTVQQALSLGAVPVAQERAVEALQPLSVLRDRITLVTYPAEMGQWAARAGGFEPVVLGSIRSGETTAEDTRRAARELSDYGAELILFTGGDGTARDVFQALGDQRPVIGIPAGVKMHSSVFAVSPRQVAELVTSYLRGDAQLRPMEVMDIDEALFRQGRVSAHLYGYLQVPFKRHLVQSAKAASRAQASSVHPIAQGIVDDMDDEWMYVLGPGTTIKAIGDDLGIDKTLLGVDVVQGRRLIGKDVNERDLLEMIAGRQAKTVVTVIGGQGYIFGRGNQQLSPRVIRKVGKDNIIVVATMDKLLALEGPLLVDTGDCELDQELSGFIRVTTGYHTVTMWKVAC